MARSTRRSRQPIRSCGEACTNDTGTSELSLRVELSGGVLFPDPASRLAREAARGDSRGDRSIFRRKQRRIIPGVRGDVCYFGVGGVVLGCVLFAALLEWIWIRLATSVDGRGLFVYPVLMAMMLDVFTRACTVSKLAGLLGILLGAIGLQRFLNFKIFARSEVGTLERDRPRPQHTSPV